MPGVLTFTTLQTELTVALVQAPPPYNVIPPDFAQLYPNAISYAESRICAEIPMLANRQQNATASVTAGVRLFNLGVLGTTPLVVLERFALITPTSARTPSAGTRWQFIKTTLDFIDVYWPQESLTQAPSVGGEWGGRYWAPVGTNALLPSENNAIVFAPTADQAYVAECTGLFQPLPLTGGNPTTYISTVYPDLLVAACMVFLTGALMRNYGAQSVDPAQAMSWEGQYQTLKNACEFEEMRKRGLMPDHPRQTQQAPA